MGKFARSKGQRGEREVIHLLQPIVDTVYREAGKEPPRLQRTSSMQADGGGCDVHGLPWLALEVKRCETLQIESWWRQCCEQAKSGQVPVLLYRQSKRKWSARLRIPIAVVGVTVVADIAIGDFLCYFHRGLQLQLEWEKANENM